MHKLRSIILAFLLLGCWLAVQPAPAQARPLLDGTEHSGVLAADETWTPAGNPHYVNGIVTIPAGVTLTLQPGVIVRSYNNYYYGQTGKIVVQGVLNASGTTSNKILFTSKDDSAPAQWSGIQVAGGTAVLSHVEVRYGGGGGGFMCPNVPNSTVCVQPTGSLTIDDGYIHANGPAYDVQDGVVAAYSAADSEIVTVAIQNSQFVQNGVAGYANGYYPILLDGPGVKLTLAGNTFANNQVNRVLLQRNPTKTQAALTLPAQAGLEAYELGADWTIPAAETLTLDPGVTLLARRGDWGRGVALVVEGALVAQGSADQPITLDATDPTYGWSGLVLRGASALGQLAHVIIRHGGTAGLVNSNQSNVLVENTARLEMTDSRVAGLLASEANYSFGALMVTNGIAHLTGNTIADNLPAGATGGVYAIRVSGSQSRLEMTDNTFAGNYINAVLLGSDGLAGTINTLRPQTGLQGYDIGVPYADFTYVLQPSGQLTLDAGVHLRGVAGPWGKGIYMEVQGKLHASGVADAPVVFEASYADVPAAWGGIHVNGGVAELYQVRVVNAGRGSDYPDPGPFPSLWASDGGSLTLVDSVVSSNRTAGQPDVAVLVENASANLINSSITGVGNTGESDYPLKVSGVASRLVLRGATFAGNPQRRVLLADNALTGADFTLAPQDELAGYELANTFTVPTGVTMTVASGVSLYGRSSAGLVIKGRLAAENRSGSPILFTSVTDSAANHWAGVIFDGAAASGSLEGVAVRYGGNTLLGGSGYPAGGLVFYNLAADAVQVRHSSIANASTVGWQIYNSNVALGATLNGNQITSNSGSGLRLSGASQVLLTNLAVLDNQGGGVNVDQSGAQLTLLHPTLARNQGYGLRVAGGASATLTDAILARNSLALRAESGGTATVDHALWDTNTTDTAGAVTSLNRIDGAAAFDPADGYHLTQYSEANGKGQSVGVADDVDGAIRPQPAGSQPDLGADEFDQTAALSLNAEKLALPPVWRNRPDPSANPSGSLFQQFWIRFRYGSADSQAQPLTVSVQDTLPAGLSFEAEQHTPAMTFSAQGQQLSWQALQPLALQGTVDIQIDAAAANPQAGSTLTNQAVVSAGDTKLNLSASTSVPVYTPLITWPVNGEICARPDHKITVEGSAQPGVTVEIYEGATLKGQSVTDAHGLFTVSYAGSQAGLAAVPLRARACAGAICSGFAQVSLGQPQSFWDPQRSWWEGDPAIGPMAGKHLTFNFRDQEGQASTSDWVINGVYGFWDTTLHLYVCEDAATGKMPTQIWVTADAEVYTPVSFSGNMYIYKISRAHNVSLQATYHDDPPPRPPDPNDPPREPDPGDPPDPDPDYGDVLVDPDGYVFDSGLGFDPANPTQHVVPGARVTCMAYLPGWGGWVTWPAHLYENQVNPQVVGSNGYFAFFTPPGQYYIQVDGPDGYQSWRSPVVTVVNEIVHVNIPLTAAGGSPTATVQSSRAGLNPAVITVPVGAWVRWDVIQSVQEDAASFLADAADPRLRLVSSPDPFASVNGWDSGRLYPGQSYIRQFNHAGTYNYVDSVGHSASVRVSNQMHIYLPILRK